MMDLFCFVLGKKLTLVALEEYARNECGDAAGSGGRSRDDRCGGKTKWAHRILPACRA